MARFSIIIPSLHTQLLERTLISVLEARDAADEVIVVDRTGYDDPYGLVGDEIELIDAPPHASLSELVGLGLRHCQSERVHLLQCGVHVEAGWCDPVEAWFDDPEVAAVSPVVQLVDEHQDQAGWVLGVGWNSALRRTLIESDSLSQLSEDKLQRVLGPSRLGGFYRRSLLCNTGSFCGVVGEAVADLDTSLRLRVAGGDCVLESRSCITAPLDLTNPPAHSLMSGRDAQRLIKMYASCRTTWTSRFATPLGITGDLLMGFWSPSRWLSMCGRMSEIAFGQRAEDASWAASVDEHQDLSDELKAYRRAA